MLAMTWHQVYFMMLNLWVAVGLLAELIARLHGRKESPDRCFMVIGFIYMLFFALTL
jgi:hypothetical protein